jgi:hypothetical protein
MKYPLKALTLAFDSSYSTALMLLYKNGPLGIAVVTCHTKFQRTTKIGLALTLRI